MEDSFVQTMSFWSILMNSDMMIKLVIILLIIFSIQSWSIVISKFIKFKKHISDLDDIFNKVSELNNISKLKKSLSDDNIFNDIIESSILNCANAKKDINDKGDAYLDNAQEMLNNNILLNCKNIIEKLEHNLHFLAIIGSSSPFIGLFGTVWGIMHSFQSIASSQTTTLAVVAPSIAEALLATGIGLFVAIPAYIFYNYFVNKIRKFAVKMQHFSDSVYMILVKELY